MVEMYLRKDYRARGVSCISCLLYQTRLKEKIEMLLMKNSTIYRLTADVPIKMWNAIPRLKKKNPLSK